MADGYFTFDGNDSLITDRAGYLSDFDVRIDFSLDDWTPSTVQPLLTEGTGTTRNWKVLIGTLGEIGFTLFGIADYAGDAPTQQDGSGRVQIRITRDATTGTITYYDRAPGTDLSVNTGWTQLGDTDAGSTSAAPNNGSIKLRIGHDDNDSLFLSGKVYQVWIEQTIGGTTPLYDPDFRDTDQDDWAALPATDGAGNSWAVGTGSPTYTGPSGGGGGSAPTIEDTAIEVNDSTGATSITVTFAGAPASGELILLFVGGGNGDEAVTWPTGFTQIFLTGTGGEYNLRGAAYKVAGGSESAAYTISTDSAGDTFVAGGIVLSGYNSGDIVEVSTSATSGGSSTTSQSTGTTAATGQANALAVAFGWVWHGVTETFSYTNSFTQQQLLHETAGYDASAWLATKALSTTGAQETTASWSTSQQASAMIVVINGALGATQEQQSVAGTITSAGAPSKQPLTSEAAAITPVGVVASVKFLVRRPDDTVDAGGWDTGPTSAQDLDQYTSDASDSTWIEATPV